MTKLIVAILLIVLSVTLYAARQQSQVEDLQRRAFLAGAACGWNPGTDRWEFTNIDRTDPDWEEAFQVWLTTEGRGAGR